MTFFHHSFVLLWHLWDAVLITNNSSNNRVPCYYAVSCLFRQYYNIVHSKMSIDFNFLISVQHIIREFSGTSTFSFSIQTKPVITHRDTLVFNANFFFLECAAFTNLFKLHLINRAILLYIKMMANAKTVLVSHILIFIPWLRVTVTDSRTELLAPAALIPMARLECASWVRHPGLTQLYILRSICHQCIYLYNIFHTDLSPKKLTINVNYLVSWDFLVWSMALSGDWEWRRLESVTFFHFWVSGNWGKLKSPFLCCVLVSLPSWGVAGRPALLLELHS